MEGICPTRPYSVIARHACLSLCSSYLFYALLFFGIIAHIPCCSSARCMLRALVIYISRSHTHALFLFLIIRSDSLSLKRSAYNYLINMHVLSNNGTNTDCHQMSLNIIRRWARYMHFPFDVKPCPSTAGVYAISLIHLELCLT